MRIVTNAMACALVLAAFATAQMAKSTKQYVTQLEPPHATLAGGQKTTVELKFRIDPEMHINSNKPYEDNLIPTKLSLDLPTDLEVVKTTYPVGKDFTFSFSPNDKLNVYTGDFTIALLLRAPSNAATAPLKVHGELAYQACNDRACFPPKKLPIDFEVSLIRAKRHK